jgi:hypothetical protein
VGFHQSEAPTPSNHDLTRDWLDWIHTTNLNVNLCHLQPCLQRQSTSRGRHMSVVWIGSSRIDLSSSTISIGPADRKRLLNDARRKTDFWLADVRVSRLVHPVRPERHRFVLPNHGHGDSRQVLVGRLPPYEIKDRKRSIGTYDRDKMDA